jgi:transcriptional regulator with XRE-family HTH domain
MTTSKTTKKTAVAVPRTGPDLKGNTRKPRTLPEGQQRLRQHLAKTLASWMESTAHLNTQVKLAEASGLGQSTIGRILNGTVSATIDALQQIADAFGRDPGELLLSSDLVRVNYDAGRYASLPKYERARVDAFIAEVIEQYASAGRPRKG